MLQRCFVLSLTVCVNFQTLKHVTVAYINQIQISKIYVAAKSTTRLRVEIVFLPFMWNMLGLKQRQVALVFDVRQLGCGGGIPQE